jgi:hypothetical protein
LNYNVLLSTLEANIIFKPLVPIITTKSAWTYTNCGKTCHTLKPVITGKKGTSSTNCHNQLYRTCSRG